MTEEAATASGDLFTRKRKFGEQLRDLRKNGRRSLTQGRVIGELTTMKHPIAESTLSNYENGNRYPDKETLEALLRVYQPAEPRAEALLREREVLEQLARTGAGPPPGPAPDRGGEPLRRRPKLLRIGVPVAVIVVIAVVIGFVIWNREPVDDGGPLEFLAGQETSPNFVIPRPIGELSRPPSTNESVQSFYEWARQYGGVFAKEMFVSFTVRSSSEAPVIVQSARVEVVERRPVPTGTWIVPDGAGSQSDRQLYADLDSDPPTTRTDGSWKFPLRATRSDVEQFTVHARANACYCLWRIRVVTTGTDGVSREHVIDDHGKPFELTASTATTQKTYLPNSSTDPWPKPAD